MSVVTTTILSNNQRMNPEYEVLSIDVVKDVNRIPYAQITLLDGDAAQQKFAISDEAFFEPGKEIEIKLRYEGSPAAEVSVFKGLVVRHAVEANAAGLLLTVEMKDEAIKLTQSRRSEVYHAKTDSEIIGTLITNSGLTKGRMAITQPAHLEIVQYYCTDWDFILSRADANGLLVVAEHGAVTLSDIRMSGIAAHTFEFGISDIYNFEIEVDVNHQYAEIQSIAWDLKNQKLTQASKARDFTLAQGNVKAATVAKTVGGALKVLSDAVPLDPKELQAWANAAMVKSRMSMIRGRISIPGFGDIRCLDLMEVAGIGKRFNGKTLVTGIRHHVDENGWQTDVQFGLSAETFAARADVVDRPAAGQLPGVNGLQIGLVTAYEDPDKQSRVKVMLPGIDPQKGEVWARLASPDAGKDRGVFFRPEPGDEVIVGFFNDDPRQAVILGSMYSPKNTPPKDMEANSKDNLAKGIVTRSGITLGFYDDEKPMVFIKTPGSNKIVFDDRNEMVQISDQHGNTITMSKDGIEIKSAKDLKIDASGNVEIKGAKVDVK
jgi:Rhs element Vgr protein